MPRRTAVVRAEASETSRGQVLAANLDLAAVVVAMHPEPNIGRVERLLALAWGSGAIPVVVLTKADLVTDADPLAEDVAKAAPGVEVIRTSVETGRGHRYVASPRRCHEDNGHAWRVRTRKVEPGQCPRRR